MLRLSATLSFIGLLVYAEAIRWLEWGTNSYSNFMLGLTLVLLAIVIVWTAKVTRPIGYLMGLSGLAFIVLGWVAGTEGFTPVHDVPMDAGAVFLSAWIIWLLIAAWWRKESVQAAPAWAIHRRPPRSAEGERDTWLYDA